MSEKDCDVLWDMTGQRTCVSSAEGNILIKFFITVSTDSEPAVSSVAMETDNIRGDVTSHSK